MAHPYSKEDIEAEEAAERKSRLFVDGESLNLILLDVQPGVPGKTTGKLSPKTWGVVVVGGEKDGMRSTVKDYGFDKAVREHNDDIEMGETVLTVKAEAWASNPNKMGYAISIPDAATLKQEEADRRAFAASAPEAVSLTPDF